MNLRPLFCAALSCLALAVLSGCGGSICTRARDVAKAKAGNCTVAFTPSDSDVQRCENSLANCTADDRAKVNAFLDCYEKVPACQAGSELSFGLSVAGCAPSLQGVSGACNAISNSGG